MNELMMIVTDGRIDADRWNCCTFIVSCGNADKVRP